LAGEPVSEAEARKRAKSGKSLCVVLEESPGRPAGFIEIGGTMYGVAFLDEKQRVYLDYTFDVIDDRVFLSGVKSPKTKDPRSTTRSAGSGC
jgi:hypothetical protein